MLAAWTLWILPFRLFRPKDREKAVEVRPAARWGIGLVAVAFFFVFLHRPQEWSAPLAPWRCAAGLVFAGLGITLAWGSVRALGRQWRIDAGLNAEHELVQSGPYRVVRHPIYASMLCMFLTAIAWIGTLPLWPIALTLFLVGTEIRVRVEDSLLRGRFGPRFSEWTRTVPAYLPFIR